MLRKALPDLRAANANSALSHRAAKKEKTKHFGKASLALALSPPHKKGRALALPNVHEEERYSSHRRLEDSHALRLVNAMLRKALPDLRAANANSALPHRAAKKEKTKHFGKASFALALSPP